MAWATVSPVMPGVIASLAYEPISWPSWKEARKSPLLRFMYPLAMVASAIFAVVLPFVRWLSLQYCVKAILNADAPTEFPIAGISNPNSWNWWWRTSTVSGPTHRVSLTNRNARPSSKEMVAHIAWRQSSLSTWPQTAMAMGNKKTASFQKPHRQTYSQNCFPQIWKHSHLMQQRKCPDMVMALLCIILLQWRPSKVQQPRSHYIKKTKC